MAEVLPLPLAEPVPERFDMLGNLPTGTTVLEASAGTGKTFTIAALVARYVAEGVATMDQLLVVSFSRESTRELRERVRERLVSVRHGLARPHEVDPKDTVLAYLASADSDEVRQRHRRVQTALADFDAATLTTTHGFCQQVLAALGTAGDQDTGAQLVEDLSDLVREVADDLYLRKWGVDGAEPPAMRVDEFRGLALDVALRDPGTLLVPDPSEVDPATPHGLRTRIALAVRAEVDLRKRRLHLFDYDDLLQRLDGTLRADLTGEIAVRRLRDRYQVVLVDEFQDTDPVQWSILRIPFHGHRTLVLIGDPKQAIYAFRGADVHAYLSAREVAGTIRTLPTSYRSDAALLSGLEALLGGAALGDPRIRVGPPEAVHEGRLVEVDGPPSAVRLRVLPRAGLGPADKPLPTQVAVDAVVRDVTAEVGRLLGGAARVVPRSDSEARPLLPGDVAVLVRTNKQAEAVSKSLRASGVPVVVTGRTSVFATPAAQEWQLLLEALEQPHRTPRVARLALGVFVGLPAAQVADPDDGAVTELALRLRVWSRLLDDRGVAAVFEALSAELALQPRLLGLEGGERVLTDLRHLAQVLHEVSQREQRGLSALVTWLRARREDAATEGSTLERSRRLDSDAAAVQVITVHTSKGLEFPVVLMPFGWNRWPGNDPATAAFHDDRGRVRDVGGPTGPLWADHVRRSKTEEADDDLRLAYVGLTRAMGHLVTWWAPTHNTKTSAMHRLLMHRAPGVVAPVTIPVPPDAAALQQIQTLSTSNLAVEVVEPRPVVEYRPTSTGRATLRLAVLNRELDSTWRRTSYSALTADAHETPRLGSEPEQADKDDEADLEQVDAAGGAVEDPLRQVLSAWDALPSGTGFGTLVHAVLEEVADVGDPATVRHAVARNASRFAPGLDVGLLTEALVLSSGTPLGRLVGGRSLAEVDPADRLPELDFELPLAGGDEPASVQPLLSDLVPLWRKHCRTGLLAGYADALTELEPAPLRGYLTGSIDCVLRVRADGGVRYVVVDYKTNRLGGYDEPLTAWHYRPEALETAMVEAHYPLQALLYGVALHRYLRWRQPAYDPDVHLGGSSYLFLRGMSGPDVLTQDGSAPGVFSWRPPSALVVGTSDLLAGAR
jgi:exodeoxyribonuclease V beta subunit